MKIRQYVERSIEKAGGVRALSRTLEWDPASIVKARDDAKLSPYRAARLAAYLEEDVMQAVCAALMDTSKSNAEARYWKEFPSALATGVANVVQKAVLELELRLSEMENSPTSEEKSLMVAELMKQALNEAWSDTDSGAPTGTPVRLVL
ncbi:MAG: hypothetical protein CMP06_08355 [Xanthomonadales bacterium]|uniref:hypothetical protein n=1 Tax=uncultured Abyssibacter sp. TaxID=2320202 RepID=UPI000C381C7C|nr:hypothetical protein [Xanthomonadales bacterium]|tara:strand:- start:84 stop:530 length:447 start_codon:yes stop_codon:yes gene_type:complete